MRTRALRIRAGTPKLSLKSSCWASERFSMFVSADVSQSGLGDVHLGQSLARVACSFCLDQTSLPLSSLTMRVLGLGSPVQSRNAP